MKYDKETIVAALKTVMPTLEDAALSTIADRLMIHLSEYFRFLLFTGEDKVMSDQVLELTNKYSPADQIKLAEIMNNKFMELSQQQQDEIKNKMDAELALKGHVLLEAYGNGI